MADEQVAKLTKERKEALAADPGLAAKEYASARKALVEDFGPNEACPSGVQGCLAVSKADRRKRRKELIRSAREAAPEHFWELWGNNKNVREAADRLEREMDDVERARLSSHVYLDPSDPDMPADLRELKAPEGFQAATPADLETLGLTQDDLTPPGSDFKAQVYKYDERVWGPEYKDRYVVATRGSTRSPQDWQNNFLNGADVDSEYYKNAKMIGAKIANSGMAGSVDATGHSLGGGLAQAIHAGSDGAIKTTTFNSAGVHDDLASRYGTEGSIDEKSIRAYRVKGEVLTQSQETGWSSYVAPAAKGTKYDLEPHDPALRDRNDLTDDERTTLHGMNDTILSIEDQKAADEATLRAAVAGAAA